MGQVQEFELPPEWRSKIWRQDGSRKKVILYGTSAGVLFRYGEYAIRKMKEVLDVFGKHREDVTVWWRPDAGAWEMFRETKPDVGEEYRLLLERFRGESWGIFDDTPEPDRAVHFCDAYFGDRGSMMNKCRRQNKAVMLQVLR